MVMIAADASPVRSSWQHLIAMNSLNFPVWKVLPPRPVQLTPEVWLEWLEENRLELLRSGELAKLRKDPLRCPVNVRFVLP